MLKRLFVLLILGGLGYAAFTVPIAGQTAARRAYEASPWEIVRKKPQAPVVTAANDPKHKGSPEKSPSETTTKADRDALDRLLPH